MVNDRTQSAMMKKSNRAEEWLKNSVRDKHVRLIPFSEISKVKYNVAKGGSGTIHLGAWRNMHVAIKEQHNTSDLIKEVPFFFPALVLVPLKLALYRFSFCFLFWWQFRVDRNTDAGRLCLVVKLYSSCSSPKRSGGRGAGPRICSPRRKRWDEYLQSSQQTGNRSRLGANRDTVDHEHQRYKARGMGQ
jgi:hypothetical protein